MKNRFYLFVVLAWISAFPASASTLKWLIKPEYDSICYYSNDIFKCIKDGKIQLIDLSGKNLLLNPADTVTDFTEGFALVLDRNDSNLKIKGFLTEKKHDFIEVSGNYYATFYSHFSEGLIAVADEKGRQGYLNNRGKIAIPCKFNKARPFVNGWAAVESDKDGVGYIDKQNIYMIIHFHYGVLSLGTNFNERGEALVGYKNNFAIINTSGKTVREYRKRPEKPYRDYDYAFCEDGSEIIPKGNNTPTFEEEPIVFLSDNSFLGYRTTDKTIVPAQFTYAGRFANGCAIVALDEKYGVVAIIEGDFSSSIENNGVAVRANKKQELRYTLNFPKKLESEKAQVRFDNGDGFLNPIQLDHGTYTFTPFVTKTANTYTIRAEVSMDSLLLWQDIIERNVERASAAPISFEAPSKTSDRADDHDLLLVKTVVTNNSETPVKVSVVFASPSFRNGSSNRLVSMFNDEVTLSPGEKRSFTMTFKVFELETLKTSVTVKSNQRTVGTKTSNIVLKPFDLVE